MNDARGRIARLLESAALACILAVLVARVFVTETPFRMSQLNLLAPQGEMVSNKIPNELLRVTFAMVLLAGFVLCSAAQTLRRKTQPISLVFAILLLAFSAWTFTGALRAVDVRGALTGWFEQTTILLSALVMMHLARDRRRLGLVIVVLAALAGVMGFKAITEATYEIPQRIAAFGADTKNQLAQVGIAPGTSQARMFEHRINDPAAVGYFGLSNVFASLLIVLAAAAGGLVAGKFAAARRSRRSAKLARGEIHLPTLAAVIAAGLVLLSLVALFLTRSKGGIASAVVAFAAAALVMLRWNFFARHRRKIPAVCAVVILAGICAVAAWGKTRGSLPGWSMQVRWEYWVGSAGIIEDKPVLGVGPGGFGDAYLRHRLPEAAESTKSPHNLIMAATVQYGLIGGAIYLAMLIWMFVAVARPGPTTAATSIGTNRQTIRWCLFMLLIVLVVRAVWVNSSSPAMLLVEVVLPACIFAVCLLAAVWAGTSLGLNDAAGRYARIALACGLAGFILHNLLTYTLWMPATATVFWVAAGALATGASTTKPSRLVGAMRIPVAILAVVGFIAAGVWLVGPVQIRTSHVRAAQESLSHGHRASAIENMKLAADADPLDAFAQAGLAKLYATDNKPAKAVESAEEAWSRSPTFSNARLLAQTLRGIPARRDESLKMASKAVELDPMNMWFRLEYADMLLKAGNLDGPLQQIHEIRRIHQSRPTISDLRLTDEELKKLDVMEKRIKRRRSDDG